MLSMLFQGLAATSRAVASGQGRGGTGEDGVVGRVTRIVSVGPVIEVGWPERLEQGGGVEMGSHNSHDM